MRTGNRNVVAALAMATALQCTTVASAPTMISAGNSVGSATSPACAAGYALTAGSCDNDALTSGTIMNLYSDKASGSNTTWTCSAINHGSFPAHLTASAICCRVPGK